MPTKYEKKMEKVLFDFDDKPNKFKLSSPSKISKRGNSAFSLPAGPMFSCPGATPACEACYAQKGRHYFYNVQSAFANNFLFLKEFEKENNIDGASAAIIKEINNNKIFRIYESGDFHSQWAVDMWRDVVYKKSDILFWAYTRSFDFNYSKLLRLSNFTLWASYDDFNRKSAAAFIRKYRKVNAAYGPWNHSKKIPRNSFICPVTNGKLEITGACEKCMLCVNKKTTKNVVFLEH